MTKHESRAKLKDDECDISPSLMDKRILQIWIKIQIGEQQFGNTRGQNFFSRNQKVEAIIKHIKT